MKRDVSSSDDEAEAEAEAKPLCVSHYHLEDENDAPVSFSVLPIQWTDSESSDGKKERVFLHGFVDNGLQKIFMQVIAWRFDLFNVKPEISLLSKDRTWVKLQKPRKSFEDTIRTILITVHFLHRLKKNPKISAKCVWDDLGKDKQLSSYEFMPSQNDLLHHVPLIGEAAKRDTDLAKSKLLLTVLEKLADKKLADGEVKDLARPGFIVDDIDNDMIDKADEESEGEDDLVYSVCELCDDGGDLLGCDGICMRSFHATEEAGTESICDSLGFTRKEVNKIQSFQCKNCEYNQHQCFACGKLGASGEVSGSEVFKCVCATCGRFYHPHCVAKLLTGVTKHAEKELERSIADGEAFTCPIHYCYVCKEMENKTEHELQFAVCRRCPKSYHRKCLPREIVFEGTDDDGIVKRAWEGILPNNRILIFCLSHEIDGELRTPIRDHIKFPDVEATVQEIKITDKKTKPAMKKRVISKKNNVDFDNSCGKSTAKGSKLTGKLSSGKIGTKNKSEKIISGSNTSRNLKANGASRMCSTENKRSISTEIEMPDCEENRPSMSEKLVALLNKDSEKIKADNQIDNVDDKTLSVKPTRKLSRALPSLDADSERRLLTLFKEATSSITLENVLEKYKFASTYAHSLRNVVEKSITVGKLEGSVDAVRTALRKLEGGCSIQDVEAVCEPDVLNQIFKWKDKLKVYLAPVLHGKRYTSYGRHFTLVEKLEGIVDKLHWYVQNRDVIVDFGCGANDFSILMKKKLEETGKKCSFKNYDLLPAKNNFSFEMRDWMTVQPKELPTGSQLIMGLNPPFGVKAALANKFIDKALEFKPKLLILIVPPETERLDKKGSPYDLVWEDEKFLSGKSFYLPGSVDVSDRHLEQWNVRSPVLYLWSRPDWTTKHKVIAHEHGHLSSQHEVLKMGSCDIETLPADHTMDGNYSNNLLKSTNDQEEKAFMNEGQKGSSPHGNVDQESREGQEYRMSKSDKTSWKRKHNEENDRRGLGLVSPAAKRQAVNEMLNPIYGRSSHVEVDDNIYRHVEPITCSGIEFGTAHGLEQQRDPDSTRSNYLPGHGPAYSHMGYSYGQPGSAHESSYRMNAPPVERYPPPHPNGLSHARMGYLGSEPPTVSRSGTRHRSVPQPGYVGGPLGFAPGPHRAYSRQNSAGWLIE